MTTLRATCSPSSAHNWFFLLIYTRWKRLSTPNNCRNTLYKPQKKKFRSFTCNLVSWPNLRGNKSYSFAYYPKICELENSCFDRNLSNNKLVFHNVQKPDMLSTCHGVTALKRIFSTMAPKNIMNSILISRFRKFRIESYVSRSPNWNFWVTVTRIGTSSLRQCCFEVQLPFELHRIFLVAQRSLSAQTVIVKFNLSYFEILRSNVLLLLLVQHFFNHLSQSVKNAIR